MAENESNILEFPVQKSYKERYLEVSDELYEVRMLEIAARTKLQEAAMKFNNETASMQVDVQTLQSKLQDLVIKLSELELYGAGVKEEKKDKPEEPKVA